MAHDADLLELINYFHSLASRVKTISQSTLKLSNDIDLIQRALKGCNRVKTPSVGTKKIGFDCELIINGVEVARCHAPAKKQAKHAAFSAVVELTKKPYLRLQEVPELNHAYMLVGSVQPFV